MPAKINVHSQFSFHT